MAQFLQYYGNAVNIQATHVVGSAELDLMDGATPALITQLIGLELGINRTPIKGRNDWSEYPAIIDIQHDPYTWTIRHRNQRAARLWMAQYYMKTLQFKLYGPCADKDTFDRLWLRGCLVEGANLEWQWGEELSDMTISGTAIQARLGDKDSSWATAAPLEGNLVLSRDQTLPNFETQSDSVNRFDPIGLKNDQPASKP